MTISTSSDPRPKQPGTWAALGITERGPSGSLYNSVVYLDDRRENAGVHRKLVPTGAERSAGRTTCPSLAPPCTIRAWTPCCRRPWDNSDEWISTLRHTAIVAPAGELIAGPLTGEAGTLTADLDLGLVAAGRRRFDPLGHYSRPDVLSLTSNHEGTTHA